MFRKEVKGIKELILRNLRVQGLETNVSIRNQTLYVHLTSPALRADLSMQRSEYVKRLNDYVGSQVITDIRFN